ncbi:uncharacterized protein ACB058_006425 [Synchiropus picturatus]
MDFCGETTLNMSSITILRHFVKQRLTSAAEEIFAAFEKTIVEYQGEISRQRQLLDAVNRQRVDAPDSISCHNHDSQNTLLVKMELSEEEDKSPVMFAGCYHSEVGVHNEAQSRAEDADAATTRYLSTECSFGQLLLYSANVEKPRSPSQQNDTQEQDTNLVCEDQNNIPVKAEVSEREGLKKEIDSITTRSFFEERYNSEDAASYLCSVEENEDAATSNPSCLSPKPMSGSQTNLRSTAACADSGSNIDPTNRPSSRPKRKYKTCKTKVHLKCPFCELVCKYNSQLIRHMRIHTDERPFPCAICGKYFKIRRHVEEHMLIHTGEKPYLCKVCGKSFTHRFSWTRHMKSHSGNKSLWCIDCGKWFHGHMGFNKHMRIHRQEQNTSGTQVDAELLDTHSSKTMSGVLDLRQFINQRLTAVAEEIFGVLEKAFVEYEEEIDRQRRLLGVIRSPRVKLERIEFKALPHKDEERASDQNQRKSKSNFEGDDCQVDPQIKKIIVMEEHLAVKQEMDFDSNVEPILPSRSDPAPVVENHQQLEKSASEQGNEDEELLPLGSPTGDAEENLFSCKICDRPFKTDMALKLHASAHMGQKSHLCNTCGRRFEDLTVLSRHMRSHTSKKIYPCSQCDKTFKVRSTLKRHMMVHSKERPYTCNECGSWFRSKYSLKTHMISHTGEKPFHCQTCGKDFLSAYGLLIHTRIHTGEKPYPCDVCGLGFRDITSLNRHVSTHTNARPVSCEICGRTFRDNSALKIHLRTHTGEKPHKCDVCGKQFGLIIVLTRHMRTHTGERPYPCGVCGKAFAELSTVKRHMLIHTDEKPYSCEDCGKLFRHRGNLKSHTKSHKCGCTPVEDVRQSPFSYGGSLEEKPETPEEVFDVVVVT